MPPTHLAMVAPHNGSSHGWIGNSVITVISHRPSYPHRSAGRSSRLLKRAMQRLERDLYQQCIALEALEIRKRSLSFSAR